MAVVPESIGKYKIMSVVAVGGMGTVYKAVHPSLKRQVIIKKLSLKSSNSSIKERFKREAQILLDLSSPYVVRMFDYFSEGRADYIVLEFVDGMSLDKLLEKQIALPPQLALLIFLDACYGLRAAHLKGIVHRDIKPGNILISKNAEVKLADFGIASGEKESEIPDVKLFASSKTSASKEGITQVGVTLGTPAYMSPEQLLDSRSVTATADIYSMGVMLYEMVTGSKPYAGDLAPETITKIKKGSYIPPKKIDKTIPAVIQKLIKKMMNPKSSKRYQTIDPVIKKIRHYLSRYDTKQIRITLAKCILSPSAIELKGYQKKKRPGLRAFLIFILAFVFANGFYLAWNNGVFHYTILRHWYTPVVLSIDLPATASINADLPARAFFFVNDNNDIPEVKRSRRIFYAVKQKEKVNSKNLTYKTKAAFLRPGEYRIKIAEGPYVWWKSVTVTNKKMELKSDFLKNAKRHLTIHTTSCDNDTGADLTGKTVFKINNGKDWVDLKTFDPLLLKTGTVYKILCICEGYENEYYSLLVDWYQDELFINGSLHKKQAGK